MNAFGFAGLLIAIASFGLGVFILIRSSSRKLAWVWFIFSVVTGNWGIGVFFIARTLNANHSLIVWRLAYVLGVIWIAPVYYHFVQVFLNQTKKTAVAVHYLIGFVFSLFVSSPLFFRRLDFVFGQFYYIRAGNLYLLFISWWFVAVVAGHLDLFRALKDSSQTRRSQIQYFFFATAVGYVGGAQTYLPKLGFDFYPWGVYAVALYPVIMGYAIMKYNLMNLRIFIRRAALLISVYAALLVAAAILVVSVHGTTLIQSRSGMMSGLEILLLTVILSLGPFLYAFFVKRSSFFHEHTMAGLTHELKSPLSTIESALDMILGQIQADAGLSNEKQKPYLDMIERNSLRLRKSIDELLVVMKLGADHAPLEYKMVNLPTLCSDILNGFAEGAKAKNIQLRMHQQHPSSSINILIDPVKIEQVISNLLSNAVKFTSGGTIALNLKENDESVIVEISDTGIGIKPEELPYLFDRFYQGEAGKRAKGTGIGLAIAKLWVEAHGGKIEAKMNHSGQGSCFLFSIPKN